jgi:DNA primase
MRRGDQDLVAFLEEAVLPALYDRLDSVFPEFGWRRDREGWVATNRDHTKGLTGARPERVVCHIPSGFLVHGGDSTTWLSYVNGGTPPHGKDFVEAVKKLAALSGVSFPERDMTPEEIERAEKRERREALLRAFLAHVHENLMADGGKDARDYLEGRGLTGPAVEDLGLFTTRDAVRSALTSKGFTADEVDASGVVHDGRWEGRLIIPWRDKWGRLGTFAARDLSGTADEASKYLYMRGTDKSALVAFGLDRALRARADLLVLVEGLLDVVNLQSRGLLNVAAVGGAGGELTEKRWEALASFGVRTVALVLDNDSPGRAGTVAAVENVIKVYHAKNVRNVPVLYVVDPGLLGDSKDPDEFVREHGEEAFRALLGKREAAELFKGRHILGDVSPESPDHQRQEAADKMAAYAGTLRGGRSALYVEDLVFLASERTGYSLAALKNVEKMNEAGRKRGELDKALRKAKAAVDRGEDPWTVASELGEKLSSIKARATDTPPPYNLERFLRESKETPAGRSSGWETLDRLEVFFNPGELSVIAGRPLHCKTMFLVNLLVNWATAAERERRDEVLVFYSHEEPEPFIYRRLISRLSGELAGEDETGWTVNGVKDYLRDPRSREGSTEILTKALERLRQLEDHLLIIHGSSWDISRIITDAHERAAHRAVGGVFVDYIQRIPPPSGGRYDRRDIEVSTITRLLKDLAGDLSVPVVAGAQIGRDVVPKEYRADVARAERYVEAKETIRKARPALTNLREGGIEQEADLVLGLLSYAADYQTDTEGEKNLSRLVPVVTLLDVGTLKNRYGVSGRWVPLAVEGRFNLIRDAETWDTV